MAEHRWFGVFLILKPMNTTLGPGVRVVAVTSTQLGKSAWEDCSEEKVSVTVLFVTLKTCSRFDYGSIYYCYQGQVAPCQFCVPELT